MICIDCGYTFMKLNQRGPTSQRCEVCRKKRKNKKQAKAQQKYRDSKKAEREAAKRRKTPSLVLQDDRNRILQNIRYR